MLLNVKRCSKDALTPIIGVTKRSLYASLPSYSYSSIHRLLRGLFHTAVAIQASDFLNLWISHVSAHYKVTHSNVWKTSFTLFAYIVWFLWLEQCTKTYSFTELILMHSSASASVWFTLESYLRFCRQRSHAFTPSFLWTVCVFALYTSSILNIRGLVFSQKLLLPDSHTSCKHEGIRPLGGRGSPAVGFTEFVLKVRTLSNMSDDSVLRGY